MRTYRKAAPEINKFPFWNPQNIGVPEVTCVHFANSLCLNKLRSLPLKYLDTTNQCANRQMGLSDIDY